jgi:sulfate adenylyltransferase
MVLAAEELPRAHGGVLVQSLLASGDEAEALLDEAERLPKIALDARTSADAELIATGVFSPLDGFIGRRDYDAILETMRLDRRGPDGRPVVFPIPITLSAPAARRASFGPGKKAALVGPGGEVVGTIDVEEVFDFDRPREAREVYRTEERAHPGVAYLFARGEEIGIAGRIKLARRTIERRFPSHHRDPVDVRDAIAARGWRRTVAFQTRNPIHRAHEYLLRCALEVCDGLCVNPLVGETKDDDVPAAVRMKCYEALLAAYFPENRVLLSVFPFAMRYAGPREAVLHAIARQNYGFSHFIVGRDHAGVGRYYGTYDAQRIFDTIGPGELAIQLFFFEHSFYCRGCGGVASIKTCPHSEGERLVLSGTTVRELLSKGEGLPPEFTRPEVAALLLEAYRARGESPS